MKSTEKTKIPHKKSPARLPTAGLPTLIPVFTLILALILPACTATRNDPDAPRTVREKRLAERGKITGGIKFNFKKKEETSTNINTGGSAGIAVNPYIWQASLETLSFMPLAQTDPQGGVIIYDWYNLPETPNQRYKANIFITNRAFRVDALKVSIFKQNRRNGRWIDIAPGPETARQIEETILDKARSLLNQAQKQG